MRLYELRRLEVGTGEEINDALSPGRLFRTLSSAKAAGNEDANKKLPWVDDIAPFDYYAEASSDVIYSINLVEVKR